MKLRNVFPWLVLLLIAALLSVPLALWCEGIASQLRFERGTPGMMISRYLVPQKGWDAIGKGMRVELAVDAPVCFVVIVAAGAIVIRRCWRTGKRAASN